MRLALLAATLLACHEPASTAVPNSDAAALPAADDTNSPGYPDCKGFGGRIHGATTCVHVDLSSGAVTPLSVRPWKQPGVVSTDCGNDVVIGDTKISSLCEKQELRADGGDFQKPVVVSLIVNIGDSSAPKRIRLDSHVYFWDFIHLWILPNGHALDVAIDYGVDD